MSQITVLGSGGSGGSGIQTIDGNSGSITGTTVTIEGGNNITTTGSVATMTVSVTGTTNHAVQVGNASGSLTSLAAATNGQLVIGSTGANPSVATLTAGTDISITNGAGSITIASAGTSTLNVTLVSSSPYDATSTDNFLAVNSSGGAITVVLPTAPATGYVYIVKDSKGSAASNNITVMTPGGLVHIDGATSFVMNTAYESANFIFDGTAYEVF